MHCKEGGIILIDKPSGLTSHDVVDSIRKSFRFKKVGHAGTLDPMATGLLIVLLGKSTKKSLHFTNYDKEYEAELCLGISTDTGDKEGKVLERKDLDLYRDNIKDIEKVFASFCGKISQTPPMYSAKKIRGKKLYELARKGAVLKREPKVVSIEEIKILNISLPHVTFYVKCSKGTYIRQLAHDIGEGLGLGAHLTSLKRTKIGPYSVSKAVGLNSVKASENIFYENILQSE